SYFEKKPVVLIMAYYRCPMLCSQVLHGAASAFKKLNFQIGDQFNVLTVSIDPQETPALAASTKLTYIKQYGDPSAAAGWHFLTGKKPEIDSLANAVGFHYKYIPQLNQYAHAAGIMVLTPAGKVRNIFMESNIRCRICGWRWCRDRTNKSARSSIKFFCTAAPTTRGRADTTLWWGDCCKLRAVRPSC